MLGDLGKAEAAVKTKVFKKTEKYFLYPVSQHARGRQRERLVLCYFEEVSGAGGERDLPISLEAATEYCWKLYEKSGFCGCGRDFVR
jgi:hypothetical protein